jgi:hypothetical protein
VGGGLSFFRGLILSLNYEGRRSAICG